MFFSRSPKLSYASVESFDYDQEESKGSIHAPITLRRSSMTVKIGLCSTLLLALLFSLSTVSTWVLFFQRSTQINKGISHNRAQWQCVNPTIRREWRTLSASEKTTYITAVQCLTTKPSRVRNNGTLYDDFPWVHKATSSNTHAASPFLPWHRYFIHIYEKALIDDCAYTGTLPYWDWSLDWQDFTDSPIWGKDGFGSNGDTNSELSVGNGHCVADGPFAGLEAMFYDNLDQPHCLSRGFQSGATKEELGKLVQPEVIADIMAEENFETFALRIEHNAHHFVSESIQGEFSKFTGPYDPVFFLHHTNLDRLWWHWQMKDPKTRLQAYNGKASKNEIRAASLKDTLELGGLRHTIPVSEVMETTSGLFCYEY
jgi:tyrosinase